LKKKGPSIYSIRNSYPELQLFRQQIDVHTTHQRPFTVHKQKINTYKFVFAALSLFYFTRGAVFFFKLSPYTTNFLIGSYSFLIKNAICILCLLASCISIALVFFLNAEKEAARMIYQKAGKKLKDLYHHNMSKIGLKRYISYGEGRQKLIRFKEIYHEALDKLHHYRDETNALIERITTSDSLDANRRELLLNHSLLEMDEKMKDIIQGFKSPDNLKLLSHASLL
jgi:hypothetical protein